MSYQDRIDTAVEIFKRKYGMSTPIALAVDMVGIVAGAWLFVQPSLLFTLIGFVVALASLSGIMNKVLHGGLE